jgi:hypothetical protein
MSSAHHADANGVLQQLRQAVNCVRTAHDQERAFNLPPSVGIQVETQLT